MPAWDSGGSGFDLDNVTGVWLRTTVEMYQWHEVTHSETLTLALTPNPNPNPTTLPQP